MSTTKRGGGRPAVADDSDLEDLLQGNKKNDGKYDDDTTVSNAPLNLDHLTKGQLDVVPRRGGSRAPGMAAVASAHCKYLCYMYPRCCGCISVATGAFVLFFLLGAALNPTETFGLIPNDYSDIRSEYDLSLGKIHHWCLKGDNDSCRCEDPLEPNSRIEFKTWNDAHKANKNKVEAFRDSELLDVAFLGESLVEEMDGAWMGRQQGDELKSIAKIFRSQFKREKSGIEGVALGIAGDTSPNVLWRLLHGEMPPDFNPRVWWLVLGMNDLGRMQCSEEVVVLGILRVIEEIRSRKPDAEIVINSMLPMADLRGGVMPQMIDYKDAFQPMGMGRGRGQMINPNADPALYARPPGSAAGLIVDGMAKVTYQRPAETTTALRNRHKGAYRGQQLGPGGVGPGGGAMGPPPPPGAPNMGAMTSVVVPPQGGDGGSAAPPTKPAMSMGGTDRNRQLKKKDDEEEATGEDAPKKTKKEIKAEKKYIKKVKKDPVNPKLNLDKTKIKVRDPKKLFLAKNRLPLWTSINAINKQLRKFAEKHEKITFFDATSIFAERTEGNKYVLQSDKISLRGHPTLAGFAQWEEAIAVQLKKMFESNDVELAKEALAAIAEQQKAAAAAAAAAAANTKKDAASSDEDDDKKNDSNDVDDDKN